MVRQRNRNKLIKYCMISRFKKYKKVEISFNFLDEWKMNSTVK